MTFDEIETALGQRLAGMTDCPPITHANGPSAGTATYLIAKRIPVSRVDDTVDGIGAFENGIYQVTVVSPRGEQATAANTLAQQIADRFPKALRLTAGSGRVVINAAPEPVEGFHDKAENWNVPVRIRYITEG